PSGRCSLGEPFSMSRLSSPRRLLSQDAVLALSKRSHFEGGEAAAFVHWIGAGGCSGHDLQLMNLTPIADAVGRAPDVQAAFDTLIAEISGVLHTRACIFQRVERGWALVAQTRGGLGVPISDLHLALSNMPPGDLTPRVDLPVLDEGVCTSIWLT